MRDQRWPMFRRVLFTQWLWARVGLVPMAVAAFAIPILAIQPFSDPSATGFRVRFLLDQLANWTPAYPVLAAAAGLLLGITAWSADHRVHHVYALSLPVPRWRFTLMRMGAGLVLVAVPVATLWLGALLAAGLAAVPVAVQTYPHALAGRFLLASMMAFAAFFAISSTTPRVAGGLLGLVAALGVTQLFLSLFGAGVDILGPSIDLITSWPGPLEVFGGRWMLIDF